MPARGSCDARRLTGRPPKWKWTKQERAWTGKADKLDPVKPFLPTVTGLILFVSRVSAQCPDGSAPPCRIEPRPTPPPSSIAVLYFENASRDTNDAYLTEGLTEAVITQLRQVERLTVQSRSAVQRFRGTVPDLTVIRQTLGVAYLVTGSLQRSGHDLRVTVDLARTANGVSVWGDQFRGSDDNLFSLQDTIARRVAEGVIGRLLPTEQRAIAAARLTRNAEAYSHLLRGNHFLARRTSLGLTSATAEYRQAAELDSGLVSALAKLGLAYGLRIYYAWDPVGAPPAESLLTRGMTASTEALRKDSLNSDAWLARGVLLQAKNPDTWSGVTTALRRAVILDPTNAEAWHQLGAVAEQMGDDSTAVVAFRTALRIDPGRAITLFAYAAMMGLEEARVLEDSALAVDPSFLPALAIRGRVRLSRHDTVGARADFESVRCTACPPDMWQYSASWYPGALDALGDRAGARRARRELLDRIRPSGSLSVPAGYAAARLANDLGDTLMALSLLERIWPRGAQLWARLSGTSSGGSEFPSLQKNPRLITLLEATRPPWAPVPVTPKDLPIPQESREAWEGTYLAIGGSGYGGKSLRVYSRGDSLMVEDTQGDAGRLLYQGGDSLIVDWDPGFALVFDTPPANGLRGYHNKRIFVYQRHQE